MRFENSGEQAADSRENVDKTDLAAFTAAGPGGWQTRPYVGIVPILFVRLILQPHQNGSYF